MDGYILRMDIAKYKNNR